MKYEKIMNTKRYLSRFDEILYEMTNEMLSAKPTDNITKYFIECMIPHHQAAIYMCENLLKYTNYRPLQEIARNIITTQTKGIKQMREIYRTTKGFLNNPRDVRNYTQKFLEITKNMIFRMENSPRYVDINLSFVGEMIPHHEGAIAMCHNLLQYCIDPRLKVVAESIIREQSEGIRQLEKVKKELY